MPLAFQWMHECRTLWPLYLCFCVALPLSFARSLSIYRYDTNTKATIENFIYLHEVAEIRDVLAIYHSTPFNRSSTKYARLYPLSFAAFISFLIFIHAVVVWCNNSNVFFAVSHSYWPLECIFFLSLLSLVHVSLDNFNFYLDFCKNVTQICWCEKYTYIFFRLCSFTHSFISYFPLYIKYDPLSPNLINQSIQWHVSKWVY